MVAGLLISFSGVLPAQSTSASLTGRVTDPSKAVIADAKITAINAGTNIRYEGTTNKAGEYDVASLPPGTYRVEVEKTGFQTVIKPDILLHVQDAIEINFEMRLGSTSETVTVEGGSSLVNTQNAAVSTVVDSAFVKNMPLNGRSFQALLELAPGVVPTTGNSYRGGFSVNGQRQDANAFMVDGVSANSGGAASVGEVFNIGGAWASGSLPGLTNLGTTQSLASGDAMEEFRAQTSTYSAEYGRQPGAQVSIVTRSGTNQFHGTLFEYLRNTVFDANNWFSNANNQPRPPERQNDFGGILGGPVRIPKLYNGKDRTFFFFSYEGVRLRLPQFTLTNVPTVALRQSVTASLQPALNAFPLPNGKDLGNGTAEFSASYSNPNTLDASSLRVDHAINDRWNVFGRYSAAPSGGDVRRTNNLAVRATADLSTWSATLGLIGILSPTLTNDFRINWSNNSTSAFVGDTFGGAVPLDIGGVMPSQFLTAHSVAQVVLVLPGRTANPPTWAAVNGIFEKQSLFNVVDSASYLLGFSSA